MDDFGAQATSESSIRVDHGEGLSFPNAAIQALIKPFERIILKPPPPTEDAGSPRINPHKAPLEICHVEESIVGGTWTYTFSNKAAEKQSTVLPTNCTILLEAVSEEDQQKNTGSYVRSFAWSCRNTRSILPATHWHQITQHRRPYPTYNGSITR
jgi:hypothetical protein